MNAPRLLSGNKGVLKEPDARRLAHHRRTAADVDEGEPLEIETIVKRLEAEAGVYDSHWLKLFANSI
jgi:hypothetical protein